MIRLLDKFYKRDVNNQENLYMRNILYGKISYIYTFLLQILEDIAKFPSKYSESDYEIINRIVDTFEGYDSKNQFDDGEKYYQSEIRGRIAFSQFTLDHEESIIKYKNLPIINFKDLLVEF